MSAAKCHRAVQILERATAWCRWRCSAACDVLSWVDNMRGVVMERWVSVGAVEKGAHEDLGFT